MEPIYNQISDVEAQAIAGVLEDCITKLAILGHRFPVPSVSPEVLEYRTLEEKFGKELMRSSSGSSSGPYSASMLKLQKDRALLEFVLTEARDELLASRSFNQLRVRVSQYEKEQREERKLLTELAQLSLTAPGLKKDLSSAKQRAHEQLRQSQQTLAKLQDKVARVRAQGVDHQTLASNWEEARAGQLEMALSKKEEELENSLEDLGRKTDMELRVHAEMEAILESIITSLHKQEAQWKEKFAKDKAEKEEKLEKLKETRADNFSKLQDLADLYRRHRRELHAYEALRLKRLQAFERALYENQQATHLQAWWRGVMVRQGLGPYKKKKKLPKEKPKKKPH